MAQTILDRGISAPANHGNVPFHFIWFILYRTGDLDSSSHTPTDGLLVNYQVGIGIALYVHACSPVFSLGCFWGVLHPLLCKHTPLSVFQRLLHPHKMMACKADLYSIVITKQLYTCKYTAIDCTIVTHAEDRGCFGLHLLHPPT